MIWRLVLRMCGIVPSSLDLYSDGIPSTAGFRGQHSPWKEGMYLRACLAVFLFGLDSLACYSYKE